MASLQTHLQNLATRVGTEVKSVRTLVNGNAADLAGLATTTKTSLMAAINELKGRIDTNQTNISNAQADATSALGDAAAAQGDATQALTDAGNAASTASTALTNAGTAQSTASAAQSDATDALANIGSLAGLSTSAKGSAVAAINEVHTDAANAQSKANTADAEIGNLASLNTTETGSIVGAINELEASVSGASGINDGTTSGSSTWSSSKISTEISSAIDARGEFKGGWDASGGSFPGGAGIVSGDYWRVTTGGTVNGQVFGVGDALFSIVNTPSNTTYANNWLKMDNTESVTSVAGKTGGVTLVKADITDFDAYVPGGTDVPISDGGTGSSSKAGAQSALGIVDTADIGNTDTNLVTVFETALA